MHRLSSRSIVVNRRRHRRTATLVAGALIGALTVAGVAAPPPASASDDVLVPCNGPNNTGSAADLLTFRQAIATQNNLPGSHTVFLTANCTYSFTDAYNLGNAWFGATATPAINADITIDGRGATIQRDPQTTAQFRLFTVLADPANSRTLNYASGGAGKLTIRDATLKNGIARGGNASSSAGGGAGLGGAIFNQGQVTLDRVTVRDSVAQGGNGHGIVFGGQAGGGAGGMGATPLTSGDGGGFSASFGNTGGSGGGGGPTSGLLGDKAGSGGGGGGFRGGENGGNGTNPGAGGAAGGSQTGTGGGGGSVPGQANGGNSGDGAGGGGASASGSILVSGGAGGNGGRFGWGGTHGGIGIGGGAPYSPGGGGGGGGVGGGGGGGGAGASAIGSAGDTGGKGGAGGGGGFAGGGGAGGNGGDGGNVGLLGDGGDGGAGGEGGAAGFGGGGGGGGAGGLGGKRDTTRTNTHNGAGGAGGAGRAGGFGGGNGSAGLSGWTGGGGGGAGMGGAIFNHQGQLTVRNSTFSGNTATGGVGGGQGISGGGGDGQGMGGAIFNLNGTVATDSATLAFNKASQGGGGIYNLGYLGVDGTQCTASSCSSNAQVTLVNSIVSNSTASAGGAVTDVVSNKPTTVATGATNLVPSSVAVGASNNIVTSSAAQGGATISGTPITSSPGLDPTLKSNVPTPPPAFTPPPTHAIGTSSPAYNTGSTTLGTDERGVSRPSIGQADIGAFEFTLITPTMTVAAQPTSAGLGSTARAKATLSGGSQTTGSVTFKLYGADDRFCESPPIFTSTNTLAGGETLSTFSSPFTAFGTYPWQATYNGDANNFPVIGGCGDTSVSVGKATPTLNSGAVPGIANLGDAVHNAATLNATFGNPTGTITFKLFGLNDTTCSAAPIFTNVQNVANSGATSANFTPAQAGTYRWTAAYSGDANNAAVATPCGAPGQGVSISFKPTLTTTAVPASAGLGEPIHATAKLVGGVNPTGTVTFTLYVPSSTQCFTSAFTSTVPIAADGTATSGDYTTGPLVFQYIGTYRWLATYSGDASNPSSVPQTCGAAGQNVDVGKAATTLTGQSNPAGAVAPNTNVTETVKLHKAVGPFSSVMFNLYSDAACTNRVFGTTKSIFEASYDAATGDYTLTSGSTRPGIGSYWWQASYNGDSDNNAASTPCGGVNQQFTIDRITPTLTITQVSPSPAQVGDAVQAKAAVGGNSSSGIVFFTVYGPGAPGEQCSANNNLQYFGFAIDGNAEGSGHIDGDGVYTSEPFVPTAPGTYWWRVHVTPTNTFSNSADEACGPNSTLVVTDALPCGPGTYDNTPGATPRCVPAPPGAYATGAGTTTAFPCSTGTYQPDSGQASCLPAPPGRFVPAPGATAPTPCATGSYQPDEGKDSCLPAPPGGFVPDPGSTGPQPCAPGTYQPDSGQTGCLPVPPGSFVPDGASSAPTPCAAGTYQPDGGQTGCLPAPPGSFVPSPGSTAPTPCAAGSYQPDSGQSSCLPAPVDHFVPSPGATEATPCPPGTTQPSTGAISCVAIATGPTASVGDASIVEGNTGQPRTLQVPITLSEASTTPVVVTYEIRSTGSATSPADFRARVGQVTFKPGAASHKTPTSKRILVSVKPDVLVEGNETFEVVLTSVTVGYSLADSIGVGTIIDDDGGQAGLTVSVGDAAIHEGNTGTKASASNVAMVRVNLSAPATTTVTVLVTVSAGSATPGSDYAGDFTRVITFQPGEFRQYVGIPIKPDTTAEGDETINLTLSDPTGGLVIGRAAGTVTILNDD